MPVTGDPISPNYTKTNDPDVVIGKHGARITRQEFEQANKNGYAWKDFDAYADYVGGWAHPLTNPIVFHQYYGHYGNGQNIPGLDVAIIQAKYQNDPRVQDILKRAVSRPGEVPVFGPDDGDYVKALIAREKVMSQASNDPNFRLSQAVSAIKQKQ